MTEQSILKAKIDLYNIISNFAMKDYLNTNYKNGKKISKKDKPYSLSLETLEAKKFYNMLCFCNDSNDITPEQEEEIKGYLLSFRTHRTEYIKDVGGNEYYKNSITESKQQFNTQLIPNKKECFDYDKFNI